MTHSPLSLAGINDLSPIEFAAYFAGVLEHSPHYAEQVARQRPYPSAEALAAAFGTALLSQPEREQLRLIRAHPDLAGKAAKAGHLTDESSREQAGAGLDRLSDEEYAEFQRLNDAYHAKFDLPYVVCVREHNKASILEGARQRLNNDLQQERQAALREISRIARLRVLDLVEQPQSNKEEQQMTQGTQVKVKLGENNYGKADVQLFKVSRDTPRHEVRDVRVRVAMTGDFDAAHAQGDNTDLVATDTVRNTIYGLAKEGFESSIEVFGQELLRHFMQVGPKVSGGFAEFTQHLWERIQVGEAGGQTQGHDHAFARLMPKRTARVESGAENHFKVISGIEELYVLKTTNSGWEGYLLNERFTTLPEAHDRVMATFITAKWEYAVDTCDYDDVWQRAYHQIQQTFTDHYSPSLQRTLYLLGQAVLTRCPEISRIWFQLPNKHHLNYNLERFGLENNNEIFHVDPEPYGLMEGWVERA